MHFKGGTEKTPQDGERLTGREQQCGNRCLTLSPGEEKFGAAGVEGAAQGLSEEGCPEATEIQLLASWRQERLIMTEGSEVCREGPGVH